MLPHWLYIYEKPALVNGGKPDVLYKTFRAYQYKHKISAFGGFDSANCEIDVDMTEAQDIANRYIGNRVAVFVDNPILPVWEGYIESVQFENGNIVLTRSIAEMYNYVIVQYNDTTLSPPEQQTTAVSNADSIAIYGTKGATFTMGELYDNGTAIANELRDKVLSQQAFPLTTTTNSGGGGYRVTINMKGFYHTLDWEVKEVTSTLFSRVDVVVEAATVTSLYNENVDVFFDNTGMFFDTNNAFSKERQKRLGETSLKFIRQMVECGDGTNDWVWGISPTDTNLGYRYGYYRQANTDVRYHTNMYRDNRLYTPAGRLVDAWDVRPDCSIFIDDLEGWRDKNTDPRTVYIERIEYDAEAAKPITWISKQDNTLEGYFQFYKSAKTTGSRFGANIPSNYS